MKKHKIFKTFGFASLAIFMGATALFTFAPLSNTPIVASGLNASASTEGETFDLGLRPDTDPVVYVTESGLEIKKSNGKYTSTTTTTTNNGKSYTQDLTSFYYFTMGTFSGTIYTAKNTTEAFTVNNEPVNWLILARGHGFEFSDNTPAGDSIKTDNPKQEFAITPGGYLPMDMQSIPEDPADEIPDNCFLVISEKLLGQMYFNSAGAINALHYTGYPTSYVLYTSTSMYYGGRYRYIGSNNSTSNGGQSWNTASNAGGSLYNYINNLFSKNNSTGAITGNNNLGFTQEQADMIVPQQLYTFYSNGSSYRYQETPETDGNTYYTMFPLTVRAVNTSVFQNFCIEDYMTTNAQRVATYIGSNQSFFWWLRAGSYSETHGATKVNADGAYSDSYSGSYHVVHPYGVRPAMVVRIME